MYKESIFNIKLEHKNEEYIFNTKTCALSRFTEPIEECISKQKYISEMQSCGFIVEDEIDEIKALEEKVSNYISKVPEKLDVTVMLTEDCNFKCVYCYQNKCPEIMTQKEADILLDRLKEIYVKGINRIDIHYFGGEPLLNQGILLYIDRKMKNVSKLLDKEYHSYMTTNGSLLSKEILKSVGFDTVQLTFDGNRAVHSELKKSTASNYDSLLDMVRLVLKESDSGLRIRFNICEENKDCFEEVLSDIFSLEEYDRERIAFSFNPLINQTGTEAFTEMGKHEFANVDWKLRKVLRDNGVSLIFPRSLISPCKFTVGNAICYSPKMKECFCTSSNISPGDRLKEFCELNKKTFNLPDVCKECSCVPMCLNSCAILKAGENGCVSEKYIIEDIIKDYIDNPTSWIMEGKNEKEKSV